MTATTTENTDVFSIGGDLPVHRLGYGAMQITGDGVWGDPTDHDGAIAVLKAAVELGVDFIDTADAYGPDVSEKLIAEALHPYKSGLVIATKAGNTRTGPGEWIPVGRPAYLKQQVELSLRKLGVEQIDLIQLHRIDPEVPIADQMGAFAELKVQGKVRHIGLSEVTVAELRKAQETTEIVSVQNRYNLTDRTSQELLDHCTREGIAFIPWAPVGNKELTGPDSPVGDIARETGVTASQVSLAWLLAISPVVLPIPGTKSVEHLRENLGAADVTLSADDMKRLNDLV